MTEEQVEFYLLDNFDQIEDVYIRKNEMKRHNNYTTFIFIVNSDEEIDIRMLENHNWPGGVKCFFAPPSDRPRY